MKTNLFIAALSLVVLAGCSSEDEIGTLVAKSDNAINFGTYVGKQTKATETNTDALQSEGKGFYVLASYTGSADWNSTTDKPNFMYNQNVLYNKTSSAWEYSPIKYWPNEQDGTNAGKVTFFAYAPSDNVTLSKADKEGTPTLTVTIPDKIDDQTDLVTDMVENLTSTTNKVQFEFNHILSKISFKIQLDKEYDANTEVKVTECNITFTPNKIKNSGTYTFATTNTVSNWAAGTTFHTGNIENKNLNQIVSTTAAPISSTMFMIPQAAYEANSITAKITYTVTTKDETNTDNSSVVTNIKEINLPVVSEGWLPNKQYTYLFSISLTNVSVTATASVWGENTDIQ